MGQDSLPLDGVVGAAPGTPEGQAPGAGDAPRGKDPRGRKNKAEEIRRHLEANGLVMVPADSAGTGIGDESGSGSGPVGEGGGAFDEETTRATAGFLVDAYSGFKADSFEAAALAALGDEGLAKRYGERAELSENKKGAIIEGTVHLCRKNNFTLSPEITLAVIAANEWREFRAMRAELRALVKAKAAADGPQPTPAP